MEMKYYTKVAGVITTVIVIALAGAVLMMDGNSAEQSDYVGDGIVNPIMDSQVVQDGEDAAEQQVTIDEGTEQVVTVE